MYMICIVFSKTHGTRKLESRKLYNAASWMWNPILAKHRHHPKVAVEVRFENEPVVAIAVNVGAQGMLEGRNGKRREPSF